MPAIKDLTGRVFKRLTVLGLSTQRRGVHRKLTWRCRCECGTVIDIIGDNLRSGASKSCGCLNVEKRKTNRLTHGATANGQRRRENLIWKGMIKRCTNPHTEKFSRYGGRGITVCARWRHDFAQFLADMGPCPPGYQIERMNNDGHYQPDNCRWVAPAEQAKNRRGTIRVTIDGETLCLKDWARRFNLNYGTVHNLVRQGVPPEQALRH